MKLTRPTTFISRVYWRGAVDGATVVAVIILLALLFVFGGLV